MLRASFILISYNQAAFIAHALKGAFSQDYTNLEIILSDDGSTDGTYELIQKIAGSYSGPHQIHLLERTENTGLIPNLNRALRNAHGEVMVIAAGDDYSHPNRVSRLVEVYQQRGRPALVHSKARTINAAGEILDKEEPPRALRGPIRIENAWKSLALYLGATASWSRQLISSFPPIAEVNTYEDLVMGFRATLVGHVEYIDEALVDYRVGVGMSQLTFKDYEQLKKERLRSLRLNTAVFRQRLSDITFSQIDRPEIEQGLISILKKEEGRLRFHVADESPSHGGSLPFCMGWLAECRKWMKIWLKRKLLRRS